MHLTSPPQSPYKLYGILYTKPDVETPATLRGVAALTGIPNSLTDAQYHSKLVKHKLYNQVEGRNLLFVIYVDSLRLAVFHRIASFEYTARQISSLQGKPAGLYSIANKCAVDYIPTEIELIKQLLRNRYRLPVKKL